MRNGNPPKSDDPNHSVEKNVDDFLNLFEAALKKSIKQSQNTLKETQKLIDQWDAQMEGQGSKTDEVFEEGSTKKLE